MSRLYNYFVGCWTMNPNFTEEQLYTAMTKGYISPDEYTLIVAMPNATQ